MYPALSNLIVHVYFRLDGNTESLNFPILFVFFSRLREIMNIYSLYVNKNIRITVSVTSTLSVTRVILT